MALLQMIVRAMRMRAAKLVRRQPKTDQKILRFLRAASLPCIRCKRKAAPMMGSETQYKCAYCDIQFPGPHHQIRQAILGARTLTALQKATLVKHYRNYADNV